MATLKAKRYAAPKFQPVDGCSAFIYDTVSLTANPSVSDVLVYRIPAGIDICSVEIQADDIDTNGTPTVAFSVGYQAVEPWSTLVAAPTYFAATGQSIARTGGRLVCSFKPIIFNEPVDLTITIGAVCATFAAGDIVAIVAGNTVGPK